MNTIDYAEASGSLLSEITALRTCLGDRETGQFHQLIKGEGSDAHKVFIQCSGILGIESLLIIVS